MTNPKNLTSSVATYARLLAEENIKVEFSSKAQTASFNVRTRTLVLPTYGKAIGPDALYGLSIHETGHAIDTDERVIELAKKYGMALINILEDVRIERLAKIRYPGAAKYLMASYRELVLVHNFFKTADNSDPFDFSHMNFLNRINAYYKAGPLANPVWSESEKPWIARIDAMLTVEDLESLAADLYEEVKNQAANNPHDGQPEEGAPGDEEGERSTESGSPKDGEKKTKSSSSDSDDSESDESESGEGDESESGEGDESESGEGDEDGDAESGEGSGDSDEDGDEEGEGSSSDSDEESEGADNDSKSGNSGKNQSTEGDDPSGENNESDDEGLDLTEEDLSHSDQLEHAEETLKKLAGESSDGSVERMFDTSGFVMNPRPNDGYSEMSSETENKLERWDTNGSKIVSKMVHEFNRKKAAITRSRPRRSDQGKINMRKLASYKTNEKIFIKKAREIKGKNHGVVLLVDLSGSMSYSGLPEVMEQAFVMTEFLNKVSVPFSVVGFSGSYTNVNSNEPNAARYMSSNGEALRIMVDSRMSSHERRVRLANMALRSYRVCGGGTPMLTANRVILPYIGKMKAENNLDVVTLMIMTDGSATDSYRLHNSYLHDPELGKMFSPEEMNRLAGISSTSSYYHGTSQHQAMRMFAEIAKLRYGVNTVYIPVSTKSELRKLAGLGEKFVTNTERLTTLRRLREGNNVVEISNSRPFSIVGVVEGTRLTGANVSLKLGGIDHSDRKGENELAKAFATQGANRANAAFFAKVIADRIATR